MRVLKFGGTSVGSPENLEKVRAIVLAEERPVVVVSAHAGVTDELIRQARAAVGGGYSLEAIRDRHGELYAALEIDVAVIEPLLMELEDLLKGVTLVGELTPRSLDLAVSFGERMPQDHFQGRGQNGQDRERAGLSAARRD